MSGDPAVLLSVAYLFAGVLLGVITARALSRRRGGGAILPSHTRPVQPARLAGDAAGVADALRRLEDVRRDFVANVSHELRTPLTVIGGFAETLRDDDLSREDRVRFAAMIVANTHRMQRIVDDLLDLSRIESGGWVPRPAVISLASAAEEVIASNRAEADAKKLRLHFREDSAADIYADPTALRQVLSNLVENAIRYTTEGEVELFAERVSGGGTRVGVRDTGPGIAPHHLPRVFERFYRADADRGRGSGGTGLGLAVVKHLVEAHGGSVQVESAPGTGTVVSALFPQPAES